MFHPWFRYSVILTVIPFALQCRSASSGNSSELRTPLAEAQPDRARRPFVRYISVEGVVSQQYCQFEASQLSCKSKSARITEPALISLVKQEVEFRLRRLIQQGQERSEESKLLKLENAQLNSLGSKLRDGIDFERGLTVSDAELLPFALRLNDIFARRQAPHIAADGSRWFLVANQVSFMGSELRCQEVLPGSRLPTAQEIAPAVRSGLYRSAIADAAMAMSPGDPELIWTSSLPDQKQLDPIMDKVKDWNEWVWAASLNPDAGIEGRLLRPDLQASLVCVAAPAN
jgi:hypothetical protein